MDEFPELSLLCGKRKWEDAKVLIQEDPELLWKSRSIYGSPASIIGQSYNMDMLEYMFNIICLYTTDRRLCFRQDVLGLVFEDYAWPSFVKCSRDVSFEQRKTFIEFFIRVCPSGPAILEKQFFPGTALHWIASCGKVEELEYMLSRTLSGIQALYIEDRFSQTPVGKAGSGSVKEKIRKYFTPQKIQEIGLQNEIQLTVNYDFESNSLVALILGIITQNTLVLLWRNKTR